jgi:hypothetical protein
LSEENYVPKPVRVGLDIERRSFFKGSDKVDPAALDRIGETLEKLFDCERKKVALERQLVRIYVADCKRLGVEPRKINLNVM